MERAAWTDERLDDLSARVDAGFERVDRDLRDLRREFSTGMGTMRTELSGQIEALRTTMLRVGGGMMIGLLGVIAAVLGGS